MQTKICGRCKIDLPIENFAKNSKKGFQSYCRSCNKIHKNEWNKKNRHKVKNHALWTRYRLRQEDWDKMFLSQNGMCAICETNEATHVDHDHKCCNKDSSCGNCVRSILCRNCNFVVGIVEADLDKIYKIIEYIHAS